MHYSAYHYLYWKGRIILAHFFIVNSISYRDFSLCKASKASVRVFSSWSASWSLTFSTASWESFAATASVRSSTWDRSSRVIRSLFEWSTFHFSTLALALFNSKKKVVSVLEQTYFFQSTHKFSWVPLECYFLPKLGAYKYLQSFCSHFSRPVFTSVLVLLVTGWKGAWCQLLFYKCFFGRYIRKHLEPQNQR